MSPIERPRFGEFKNNLTNAAKRAKETLPRTIGRIRESGVDQRLKETRKAIEEQVRNNPEIRRFIRKSFVEILSDSERASALVMRSRQSRLRIEQLEQGRGRGCLFHSAKTVLEIIPGQVGPYGVGDLINLVEGVWGRELLGRRLDGVDRVISIAAAAIPVMPATPLREIVRNERKNLEDSVAENLKRKRNENGQEKP